MKDFLNKPAAEKFYMCDLYSIDEFILVNGEGGLYTPENIIKRLYFDVYDEISKAETQIANYYTTTLNYSDFLDDFDIGLFWHNIEQNESQLKIENNFKNHCLNYLDNHQNFKIVPILLSDIINYTNSVINKLEDIKSPNRIQLEVINYFITTYNDFLEFLFNRYNKIYPEIFLIGEESEQKSFLITKENPHPRIFKTFYAFNLFEKLLLAFNIKEKSHTDFSFVYRQMQYDKHIYQVVGDTEFRSWFNDNYNIWFEKTKTLKSSKQAQNNHRMTVYNNCL